MQGPSKPGGYLSDLARMDADMEEEEEEEEEEPESEFKRLSDTELIHRIRSEEKLGKSRKSEPLRSMIIEYGDRRFLEFDRLRKADEKKTTAEQPTPKKAAVEKKPAADPLNLLATTFVASLDALHATIPESWGMDPRLVEVITERVLTIDEYVVTYDAVWSSGLDVDMEEGGKDVELHVNLLIPSELALRMLPTLLFRPEMSTGSPEEKAMRKKSRDLEISLIEKIGFGPPFNENYFSGSIMANPRRTNSPRINFDDRVSLNQGLSIVFGNTDVEDDDIFDFSINGDSIKIRPAVISDITISDDHVHVVEYQKPFIIPGTRSVSYSFHYDIKANLSAEAAARISWEVLQTSSRAVWGTREVLKDEAFVKIAPTAMKMNTTGKRQDVDKELFENVIGQVFMHLIDKFPDRSAEIDEVIKKIVQSFADSYDKMGDTIKAKEAVFGIKIEKDIAGYSRMGRLLLEASRIVMLLAHTGTAVQNRVYYEGSRFLSDQGNEMARNADAMLEAAHPEIFSQ